MMYLLVLIQVIAFRFLTFLKNLKNIKFLSLLMTATFFFELAKRKFEIEIPDKWKTAEFYVDYDIIGTQPFEKPIIVVGESHYEKAVKFLNDREKPDYPAASNYFRKALGR